MLQIEIEIEIAIKRVSRVGNERESEHKMHEVNMENIRYASLLRANIIKLSTI